MSRTRRLLATIHDAILWHAAVSCYINSFHFTSHRTVVACSVPYMVVVKYILYNAPLHLYLLQRHALFKYGSHNQLIFQSILMLNEIHYMFLKRLNNKCCQCLSPPYTVQHVACNKL